MPVGYFALVLHAHLPFVRHPQDPTVMEEQWLYEGITGTYLPLIQMFEGLVADAIAYRCTVSLSAPLITMLTDDLLKERYARHLDRLIELAERELDRTRPERTRTHRARCPACGGRNGARRDRRRRGLAPEERPSCDRELEKTRGWPWT